MADSGCRRHAVGGDTFGRRLRKLNQDHQLPWTCLAYRHTYASQRAAEGWTLFGIAKEMGNSVAVVEEYYAGYIRPGAIDGRANRLNVGRARSDG
jgi:hypothetical protein